MRLEKSQGFSPSSKAAKDLHVSSSSLGLQLIDKAHTCWGGQSALRSLPIPNLILFRNSYTDTQHHIWSASRMPYSPVKLVQKFSISLSGCLFAGSFLCLFFWRRQRAGICHIVVTANFLGKSVLHLCHPCINGDSYTPGLFLLPAPLLRSGTSKLVPSFPLQSQGLGPRLFQLLVLMMTPVRACLLMVMLLSPLGRGVVFNLLSFRCRPIRF